MYVDPPYPNNGCNYAHNMRSWEEHRELAARLNETRCRWIYSSYDSPEIRDLFAMHHIKSVQSASGMADKKGGATRVTNQEVLITNFDLPPQAMASEAHPTRPAITQPSLGMEAGNPTDG